MSPNVESLRPSLIEDLIRLGRDNDGGYVISERSIRDCTVLIGLGINTDWSFEEAVLARYPGMALVAVDGTVSARRLLRDRLWHGLRAVVVGVKGRSTQARDEWALSREFARLRRGFRDFFSQPRRVFLETMVHDAAARTGISWADIVEHARGFDDGKPSRWFVKMDIEGAEYRALPELLQSADRIDGLVVEFHDCDLMAAHIDSLLERMKAQFVLAHVHGNNYGPLIRGSRCPRVLEISFVNRRLVSASETARINDRSYPISLDQPNRADTPDYAFLD